MCVLNYDTDDIKKSLYNGFCLHNQQNDEREEGVFLHYILRSYPALLLDPFFSFFLLGTQQNEQDNGHGGVVYSFLWHEWLWRVLSVFGYIVSLWPLLFLGWLLPTYSLFLTYRPYSLGNIHQILKSLYYIQNKVFQHRIYYKFSYTGNIQPFEFLVKNERVLS